ncbi:MAG: tRNA adenosine(34) deaminase TadA [Gammaproteobacteria bacterium]|nr:tRNA adenosine(34) deaminase TadA [Gammaproteobacteria bacterium]MCP4088929.1 tRNA adenosine(34) deaminase TadA [Gammaproteobacteria bacterium]MCP4274945.1 tRNA adenosine(34) deaminase TadA [Gammaproteobacteria bacterium]MCP4831988.1 tRNA adenosine(34) deaminase TadA [Gammaproteobacteria bacterium]MCP4929423.1 tRNA adenosine(34) deaminase TadA [Gammaproteobacteria bacterium]
MTDADVHFMGQALGLAQAAEANGEVPVGAILVVDGEIVGRGSNASISLSDPTAHAEIQALREAATHSNNYRLKGSTLYVTLEPCPMCAGAMVHARVERLVYACSDPRSGAAGSVFNLVQADELNHRMSVTDGVLENESKNLLQTFFRARRK